jgi:quinol monooxygenase YgiN
MANLDVVAVIAAKPGSESVVAQALQSLVGPSRADSGCISYDLFASESVPGVFVTVEKWESQEALDAHLASPALAEALASAGEHLDGAPPIHPLRPLEP